MEHQIILLGIGAFALGFLFLMNFNSAAYLSSNVPDRTNGQVQVSWAKYSFDDDGAVALAEVCYMARIPKGARIIDVLLGWTALPAGTTITVGDSGDADGYFSLVTATNAGHLSLFGGVTNGGEIDEGPNAYQFGKEYTAADYLVMTFATDIPVAADVVNLCVLYTVEGGFDDQT